MEASCFLLVDTTHGMQKENTNEKHVAYYINQWV
jgi:hypothetical protein